MLGLPSLYVSYGQVGRASANIIKIKIHSSCEIEDYVETLICKLCVILRSRVLRAANMYHFRLQTVSTALPQCAVQNAERTAQSGELIKGSINITKVSR